MPNAAAKDGAPSSSKQAGEAEEKKALAPGSSSGSGSTAPGGVAFTPAAAPEAPSDLDQSVHGTPSKTSTRTSSPTGSTRRSASRENIPGIDYDNYNVSLCGCCKSRRACTEACCFFPRMIKRIKHMRAYSYGTRAEREAAEAKDRVQEAADAVLCHPCVVECVKASCEPLLRPLRALMGCSAFLDECIPQCRYCCCPCCYSACEGASMRLFLRRQWRMGKDERASCCCTCCGNECLCRDCCEYFWCPCCALTKDYRERKLRNERRPPPEAQPSFQAPETKIIMP